jgi:multidrug efflux pump subunit AcrA (membrane-fusion protein)
MAVSGRADRPEIRGAWKILGTLDLFFQGSFFSGAGLWPLGMDSEVINSNQRHSIGTARSGIARGFGVAIVIALVCLIGWKILHRGGSAPSVPPPAMVTVASPISRNVAEWDDFGRFAPSQSVDVRPRVAGQITSRHFKDGDTVKHGQLLFTIDQRPFIAAVEEARAQVASAQSALLLAKSDLARAQRLIGDGPLIGNLRVVRSGVAPSDSVVIELPW